MKLHLGCGRQILKGYLNIDSHKQDASDDVYIDDAITLKKFREEYSNQVGNVKEIISFHLLEHLPRPGAHCPNAEDAIKCWWEILRPHGLLTIECPDFQAVVEGYVSGDKRRIDNVFGKNRFPGDVHQWGYTYDSLRKLLEENKFQILEFSPGTDYHAKLEPCMRMVSKKVEK